jgi:hypothetical protein
MARVQDARNRSLESFLVVSALTVYNGQIICENYSYVTFVRIITLLD